MADLTDASESGRWLTYGRWVLRTLLLLVFAAVTNGVFEMVADSCSFGASALSDLPEPARAGFQTILRKEVYNVFRRRIVGGIAIVHSGLLKATFPGHCFVRVDTASKRYWWSPGTWGSFSKEPNSIVCVIPLDGGEPIRLKDYEATFRFFREIGLGVRSDVDAERIRRLLLELHPRVRALSRLHERVSDTEWRIAIHEYPRYRWSLNVTTDAEGRFVHGEFHVPIN